MNTYTINNYNIIEYPELESTNKTASEIPFKELKDRTVIFTRNQTRGKGQVGNKWESEPFKNLSLTIIYKPLELDASKQFAISMVISLGIYDFLSKHTDNISIKWPNDIYAGHKKICGILIEHNVLGNQIGSTLCGIGININQEKFISDAPNPVSLKQITHKEYDINNVLKELLECIEKRYEKLNDFNTLKNEYLNKLYLRNGIYSWKDNKEIFQASIRGITDYGQLILEDLQYRKRIYNFKEVEFI